MTERQENNLKPFGLFAVAAGIVAVAAGVGNNIVDKDYTGVAYICVLSVFAVPTIIKLIKYVFNNGN